jgi:hypothetical protein
MTPILSQWACPGSKKKRKWAYNEVSTVIAVRKIMNRCCGFKLVVSFSTLPALHTAFNPKNKPRMQREVE